MKKNCGYLKLLIKSGEIMNNEFFLKEKKMQRIFKFKML